MINFTRRFHPSTFSTRTDKSHKYFPPKSHTDKIFLAKNQRNLSKKRDSAHQNFDFRSPHQTLTTRWKHNVHVKTQRIRVRHLMRVPLQFFYCGAPNGNLTRREKSTCGPFAFFFELAICLLCAFPFFPSER